jgi:Zn-dependent peptidase ImmA (M78 family)/transcriptional regulator with XRE-family HTH domain
MIGSRLRQARLVAGLTLDEVVERLAKSGVEISKQCLSNYEKEKRVPRADILMVLARAVKVRPAFLMKEPAITVKWVAYRSQARLGSRKKEEIVAQAEADAERQMYLQEMLFSGERPTFPLRRNVCSGEDAEKAAEDLRTAWKLGNDPIESVTQTVESNGGMVIGHAQDNVRFDGLSGWVNNAFPLIIVNSSVPDDRLRFDLAHELGHLAMDCGTVDEKTAERLAHRFAGAFLVPACTVRQELGASRRKVSSGELGVLKKRYGLSMQAWMFRALDLGIISEGHFRSMRIRFSAEGWTKKEPVDYVGDEKPSRLLQMTLRALAEDLITYEKAVEICPEAAKQIEPPTRPKESQTLSAQELLRMPRTQRMQILDEAATVAKGDYSQHPELTDFEALGEADLHE